MSCLSIAGTLCVSSVDFDVFNHWVFKDYLQGTVVETDQIPFSWHDFAANW